MRRAHLLFAASGITLVACGSGGDGETGAGDDQPVVVEVVMTDMAFSPPSIDVDAGDTITFVFRNDGAVRHEAVFGTLAEQETHHAEMAERDTSHSDMDRGSTPHDETELHAVVVEPGATAEVTHTFTDASTVVGCHEPGHWEAGMRLDIDV